MKITTNVHKKIIGAKPLLCAPESFAGKRVFFELSEQRINGYFYTGVFKELRWPDDMIPYMTQSFIEHHNIVVVDIKRKKQS